MSRAIHASTIAELAKDSFTQAHLVKIDFETPVYLTESPIDLVYSGQTYTSSSALKSIPSVTESAKVQVGTANITLSGVSQEYIAILLSQAYIVLNSDYSIIGNPILIYDGRVQSFTIKDSVNSSTILINAASHWGDFDKKAGRRTNHNSQQMFFPGDQGFEFAPNSVRDLKWGKA